MLNKEEIEKAKGWLSALDIKSEFEAISKEIFLQYIDQLETEKQKLIDILERENEEDAESVKRYEKMRRNTTSEYYKKSYQTNIHKLNAKRETRRSILKIMKGEK